MAVTTTVPGTNNLVLQEAIGMFTDEAYTNAKKLSGTGIVSGNPDINTDTETFIGQLRWRKPMNPTINIGSIVNAADGVVSTYGSAYLRYIKTVRSVGAEKVNIAQIITQEDGLQKLGRDFAETKSQDEHNHILSTLKGVMIAEALNGAAAGSGATGLGGQTFDNDPTDARYGMYVDLGSNKLIVDATTAIQGAARAAGFLDAMGMAYKDYEPEYLYLVVSPAVFASLRAANLTDEVKVTEGNITFTTIFGGKFRLISSRAAQSLSSTQLTKINTGPGVDIVGTITSFLVLPGAIALENLMVPKDVEVYAEARSHGGTGTEEIWHRWGRVLAPVGYDWNGVQTDFPSDADCMAVVESGTQKALTAATNALASTSGVWQRKFSSALSLGIVPIFHT